MSQNRYIDFMCCVKEFLDAIVKTNYWKIKCIILYGGLVRDKFVVDEWSDIDLIIIFEYNPINNIRALSEIVATFQNKYSLRLDVNLIGMNELIDEHLRNTFYNSSVINALAMRDNVSEVIYGSIPQVEFSYSHEKESSLMYLHTTITALRAYMLNLSSCNSSACHFKQSLQRITRWVFSIVRASLRLFDVFCHPYDESIMYLNKLFPSINTSVLFRLSYARINNDSIYHDYTLLESAYEFAEQYVVFILMEYHKNKVIG